MAMAEAAAAASSLMPPLTDSSRPSSCKAFAPRLVEPGRLICSLNVPPRLLAGRSNAAGGSSHGEPMAALVDVLGSGAIITTVCGAHPNGVSLEINISYFDSMLPPSMELLTVLVLKVSALLELLTLEIEHKQLEEIEIEARALHVGQSIGVASIELRKKHGKIIAQGRHSKHLAVSIPGKM